jgi:hypothetical protein
MRGKTPTSYEGADASLDFANLEARCVGDDPAGG